MVFYLAARRAGVLVLSQSADEENKSIIAMRVINHKAKNNLGVYVH